MLKVTNVGRTVFPDFCDFPFDLRSMLGGASRWSMTEHPPQRWHLVGTPPHELSLPGSLSAHRSPACVSFSNDPESSLFWWAWAVFTPVCFFPLEYSSPPWFLIQRLILLTQCKHHSSRQALALHGVLCVKMQLPGKDWLHDHPSCELEGLVCTSLCAEGG